ncbi:MAG: phosphatase PAP2 family protein [candidate division Zixibacteria bacterium]|nr:phosphatase PAP2 family protein [candidate division Zixibacteria bacterium]
MFRAVLTTLLLVLSAATLCPAYDVSAKDRCIQVSSGSGSIRLSSPLTLPALASLRQVTDSSDTDTRSRRPFLLGDLWYAGRTTIADAARIYSSPARLNTRNALFAGGIIAVGGILLTLDDEIHAAVIRSRDDQPLKAIIDVGEEIEVIGNGGKTAKYYLGALVLGYVTGYDRLTWLAADVVESYYIAGGVKNLANFVASRERPRDARDSHEFSFNGDGTSFPSGHAANVIQLANIISRHADCLPVTVAAYTLAGTVSLQRISSDSHWPSDVYFALVYGWFVSDEILKLNHTRRLAVTPTADTRGGLGLSVRFAF